MVFGRKRGQAAMEFVTTYGWAILIIAIVLAAFIWLGVFSPKTPDWCSVQGMGCDNAYISASSGKLTVKLTNRFSEKILICAVYCSAGPVGANGLPKVGGALLTSAAADRLRGGCLPGLVTTTAGGGASAQAASAGGTTEAGGTGTTGGTTTGGTTTGGTVTVPATGETTGSGIITGPSSGTGQIVVGEETAAPGIPVAGQSEQVVSPAPGKTVMLQASPPPQEEPSPSAPVDLSAESSYLEIGQARTLVSNLACMDANGEYVSLQNGEKYNGKLYVEYIVKNGAAGEPARLLTGELSATAGQ